MRWDATARHTVGGWSTFSPVGGTIVGEKVLFGQGKSTPHSPRMLMHHSPSSRATHLVGPSWTCVLFFRVHPLELDRAVSDRSMSGSKYNVPSQCTCMQFRLFNFEMVMGVGNLVLSASGVLMDDQVPEIDIPCPKRHFESLVHTVVCRSKTTHQPTNLSSYDTREPKKKEEKKESRGSPINGG
jgi:hypothetical protein